MTEGLTPNGSPGLHRRLSAGLAPIAVSTGTWMVAPDGLIHQVAFAVVIIASLVVASTIAFAGVVERWSKVFSGHRRRRAVDRAIEHLVGELQTSEISRPQRKQRLAELQALSSLPPDYRSPPGTVVRP